MESIGSWRKLPKKKSAYRNEKSDQLIREIKNSLDRGAEMGQLLSLLMTWINIQLKHGREFDEIAAGLNEFDIPTVSGVGIWRAETVDYLIGMHGKGRIPGDRFQK